MSASVTESAVLDALRPIVDPDFRRSIVDLGFIKNLKIDGGRVSFEIELTTVDLGGDVAEEGHLFDLRAEVEGVGQPLGADLGAVGDPELLALLSWRTGILTVQGDQQIIGLTFLEGEIISTRQLRPAGPTPDPEDRALKLIRGLSIEDFGSDLSQPDLLLFRLTTTRSYQKVAHQVGGPATPGEYPVDTVGNGGRMMRLFLDQLGISGNAGNNVIEVVSHPSGQPPQGLHFLGFDDLRLQLFLEGNVDQQRP